MIRVSNIKIGINENAELQSKIAKKLKIDIKDIRNLNIYKESLDVRNKENILFVYTVDVEVDNEKRILSKFKKDMNISPSPDMTYKFVSFNVYFKNRPIIIGFGPAGMFAALVLAEMGYNPIIFEMGQCVEERTVSVENFWNGGKLNINSNVQFGEGGAGTFSDGKLTTRIKDLRCRKVLEEMIEAGAPEEILYAGKPHVGTDRLKVVVRNIRNKIISLGGEIHFNSKVTDLIIENKAIVGVKINDKNIFKSENIILAVGHSARDLFSILYQKGVNIEQKPFAMGVRIEHKQKEISLSQYGDIANKHILGPADYRLTYTTKSGRSVYTFCMCPGGEVVSACSEDGMLVTNGMSYYSRDNENANSALLVQVFPKDFGSSHILAGMFLQRELEKAAFLAGGENYYVPAQLLGDFLENKSTFNIGNINYTYKPGIKFTNLNDILPSFICEALKEAIPEMGKKLKGFDNPEAVLTAVETRSSSPIRVLRNSDTFESTNVKGLFPVGEGAGYAGGIISAAVDGILAAEKLVEKNIK